MTKYICIFSLLLFSSAAWGQVLNPATDAIEWHVDRLNDLTYDSLMAYEAMFITRPASSVEWLQQKGAYSTRFKVTDLRGNWQNVYEDGDMAFDAIMDGIRGIVTIKRRDGKVSVLLSFMDQGVNLFPFEFYVTVVKKKV